MDVDLSLAYKLRLQIDQGAGITGQRVGGGLSGGEEVIRLAWESNHIIAQDH